MRILLVYCHPVAESYCAALREAAIRTLKITGHEVDLLDLYDEKFDPVMQSEEELHYNATTLDTHPLPAQAERVRQAEGLLFVYPTWWYGPPAMLKGWLDRVLTPNVAYQLSPGDRPIRPLLTQIRFIGVITTCGATRTWSNLMGHPGRRMLLRGVRALCARRCKSLYLAHYSMDQSTAETRAAFQRRVEKYLAKI
ncbi:NAD(P)H-dependent oxidoreductase [Pseudohoeflea coraliihabitans]|uniref:NAD(P)H-dependent oxidoreductase n=1 Tax=Pseudohoeflea coraliihabitans TaxID=2860393 RepID=A0ABS6WSM2_9HYPH|nr:NAD(P)H-dependent oxidoreductase [Pseudohoeflea sp. DP4N28-3]MBW3098427.1 NAD(P)H-dependent oxidoreductase [Pseudohoeflea sp. DP4N28-3]